MNTPQYEDRNILMKHIIEGNQFNIPTYQRKLVWNKKRQILFLRNVLEGEPFGIILIREKKEEGVFCPGSAAPPTPTGGGGQTVKKF